MSKDDLPLVTRDRSLAEQGYVKVRMSDDDGFTETAWAVRIEPGKDHFGNPSP